jgi:hypothetical protein
LVLATDYLFISFEILVIHLYDVLYYFPVFFVFLFSQLASELVQPVAVTPKQKAIRRTPQKHVSPKTHAPRPKRANSESDSFDDEDSEDLPPRRKYNRDSLDSQEFTESMSEEPDDFAANWTGDDDGDYNPGAKRMGCLSVSRVCFFVWFVWFSIVLFDSW